MNVKKRNGSFQQISFDKILFRLQSLCDKEPKLASIDVIPISQKIILQLYSGIETYKLDELGAQICASQITTHPQFGTLASRLIISNNHKLTSPSFSETAYLLYNNKDEFGDINSLISEDVYTTILNNKEKLNSEINYESDFLFDYFGFKTLEKAYLINIDGKIIERVQHMIMRVALGIHGDHIEKVIETYRYMSNKHFIHATPTLFHSGTKFPQLLSCFLLGMEDSVDGIYKCVSDCAKISKWAGGIGVWAHNIRAFNSYIKSTNGKSNGIIPMLRVLNATAKHINQSGKRNGSFAIYLSCWHADIETFLEAKKNHGDEEARARDLFYALWISDLFMKRVKNNETWSLMCPNQAKGLSDVYGSDFEKLYIKYEDDPKYIIKKIPAQELWEKILIAQIETGTPYILYKDACNMKSNQKNIGTIKSSNLCTEIIEYSDEEQYACCTLGSLGLPSFIEDYDYKQIAKITLFTKSDCIFCKYAKTYLKNLGINYTELDFIENRNQFDDMLNIVSKDIEIKTVPQIFIEYTSGNSSDKDITSSNTSGNIGDNTSGNTNGNIEYIGGFSELFVFFKPKFNFKKLYDTVRLLTYNLNKIIDINHYPVPETRYSNKLHRPIGIGVQGLADVYFLMRVAFDSKEAILLNKQIFATIYYASLEESLSISKLRKPIMLKIKELRKIINTPYRKANEYRSVKDNIYNWCTGNSKPIYTNLDDEKILLTEYENKVLPIDEELYNANLQEKEDNYMGAYSSFKGSPLSEGKFQFDLWNKDPLTEVPGIVFEWDTLRQDICDNGVRNSLLVAPMPTASTSQILGNNECIEPITSNIYSRSVLAGTYVIVNKYLLNDLIALELWNDTLKNQIISNGGTIQTIENIPDVIKNLYKTAWDLSQKAIIDQSADRGIYVCQSQSLNLFLKNPDFSKLSSMHMYAFSKGLKTGMYYLRTKAVARAQQFTIEPEKKDDCEMCSA